MARDRLQQSGINQSYADHSAPYGGYGQAEQGYSDYNANANNSYGQQDQYAMGGNRPVNGGSGDFWKELSVTNALLTELEQKINAISKAQLDNLNSTDANSIAYTDQLSNDAHALRAQCKDQIQSLYKLIKGDNAARGQAEAAKKRFTDLLSLHRQVEKDYRQKTRERAERQFKIVKPDATPQEISQVIDQPDAQVFSQALLSTNRYGAARGAYREVQERHNELQKIEKTMSELAQMFSEMSQLVEQQDEQITQIHDQSEGVGRDVQGGLTHINQAKETARKTRRKRWICFWISVVIIIILVIILVPTLVTLVGKAKNN